MNVLLIYLGYFYVVLGLLFLFLPLIYLEIGRPKDLIKAGLNLLVGIILIIKKNTFANSFNVIFLLLSLLTIFYVAEICFSRWNQLTDKEKNKLITVVELKKNLLKILEAVRLAIDNLKNNVNFLKLYQNEEQINKKKWVRNDKNDNMKA